MKGMKRKSLATALLLTATVIQPASAQWVVFDPANFSQNLLTELNTLKTTLNEVTQIANQITQIAHEVQNLQQFPAAMAGQLIGQYVQQYQQLVQGIGSIQGIAQNVGGLTQRYNQTFPNTPINGGPAGPLTAAQIMAQVSAWLANTRQVYQGAYNTQAQVMTAIGADSATITALAVQSGHSQGNLDAVQTGNQLQAAVASQLLKMNQQVATMDQAQLTYIAQQTQMLAVTQQQQADAMNGYGQPSTAVPQVGLAPLH